MIARLQFRFRLDGEIRKGAPGIKDVASCETPVVLLSFAQE